ncbi:hypothetical protein GCM10023217_15850 [Gordonia alkaliphila]|uniref:Uncharacterized protein n=1 Tax=Gordonia alkaliphila TaxID=1053547 RepID=A0ABP8Z5Y7_9ACTN
MRVPKLEVPGTPTICSVDDATKTSPASAQDSAPGRQRRNRVAVVRVCGDMVSKLLGGPP